MLGIGNLNSWEVMPDFFIIAICKGDNPVKSKGKTVSKQKLHKTVLDSVSAELL